MFVCFYYPLFLQFGLFCTALVHYYSILASIQSGCFYGDKMAESKKKLNKNNKDKRLTLYEKLEIVNYHKTSPSLTSTAEKFKITRQAVKYIVDNSEKWRQSKGNRTSQKAVKPLQKYSLVEDVLLELFLNMRHC